MTLAVLDGSASLNKLSILTLVKRDFSSYELRKMERFDNFESLSAVSFYESVLLEPVTGLLNIE